MRLLASIALLLLAAAAQAGIYRWVEPDGTVIYSDRPHPAAQEILLPPAPPPPPSPRIYPPGFGMPQSGAPRREYGQLVIRKPLPGDYVRDEGQGIEVSVSVEPELKADSGHRIQILLDGRPGTPPSAESTQWITNAARGGHSVAARIIDGSGRALLTSRSVSFQYQRPSHFFTAPGFAPSSQPARAAPNMPAPTQPSDLSTGPVPGPFRSPGPSAYQFPRAPNVPVAPAAPAATP